MIHLDLPVCDDRITQATLCLESRPACNLGHGLLRRCLVADRPTPKHRCSSSTSEQRLPYCLLDSFGDGRFQTELSNAASKA